MNTHIVTRIGAILTLIILNISVFGQQGQRGEKAIEKTKKEIETEKEIRKGGKSITKSDMMLDSLKVAAKAERKELKETRQNKISDSTSGSGKMPAKEKVEDNKGKGNAYGKNKAYEGKEFGQDRAAQAKAQKELKQAVLDTTLQEARNKVTLAEEKIKRAKNELEELKRLQKISDTDYKQKKEKIARAEDAVRELEEEIKQASEMD